MGEALEQGYSMNPHLPVEKQIEDTGFVVHLAMEGRDMLTRWIKHMNLEVSVLEGYHGHLTSHIADHTHIL